MQGAAVAEWEWVNKPILKGEKIYEQKNSTYC